MTMLAAGISVQAQTTTSAFNSTHWFDGKNNFHHHRAYFLWGYNREKYSNSDIHFHGTGYDFTVYDVKAKDRQSPFNAHDYLVPWNMTIPQYNLHVGYFFKRNFHISFGNDHMKYVMVQNQTVKMSGVIDTSSSKIFAGTYLNTDKDLTADFLTFEHTNGLNLYTVNFEYLLPVYQSLNNKFHVGVNMSVGGFVVLTKTEVHYFGHGLDNHFHISGVCVPVSIGPRIDFLKYFFAGAEFKAGYMHLPWVILQNNKIDLANHDFTFLEHYVIVGLSIPLGKHV